MTFSSVSFLFFVLLSLKFFDIKDIEINDLIPCLLSISAFGTFTQKLQKWLKTFICFPQIDNTIVRNWIEAVRCVSYLNLKILRDSNPCS
jgi:hypothetical protein